MKVYVVVVDYGTRHEAEQSIWAVYSTRESALRVAESVRAADVYAADVEEHEVLGANE